MDQATFNRSGNMRSNSQSFQTTNWQRWGPVAGAGALALLAIAKRSKAGR